MRRAIQLAFAYDADTVQHYQRLVKRNPGISPTQFVGEEQGAPDQCFEF